MAIIEAKRSPSWVQPACSCSPLSAVQHIRSMNGGTQSHLLRASDGLLYVTKFQNNPQHARILASEFLATKIGLWLGLPMPHVDVIDVPEWLVNHSLGLRIENDHRLVRCSSGRQLAFRYVADERGKIFHRLSKKIFERVINRQDFARVLVFDKWVGNCDGRQAVFTSGEKRGKYRATFVDQHYCFNGGRWTFPDMPHMGIYEYGYVYRDITGWHDFEPVLSRAEKIDRFDLWKFATEIPPEWYQHETKALSHLIEKLYKRRKSIPRLIEELWKSESNPFPNWTKAPASLGYFSVLIDE
jgi:hypothetical protein